MANDCIDYFLGISDFLFFAFRVTCTTLSFLGASSIQVYSGFCVNGITFTRYDGKNSTTPDEIEYFQKYQDLSKGIFWAFGFLCAFSILVIFFMCVIQRDSDEPTWEKRTQFKVNFFLNMLFFAITGFLLIPVFVYYSKNQISGQTCGNESFTMDSFLRILWAFVSITSLNMILYIITQIMKYSEKFGIYFYCQQTCGCKYDLWCQKIEKFKTDYFTDDKSMV